ncbi:MAG: secondary thiamine-phosphate synthase enzyme YjbQ [Mariprofundaceae bacterium]|nr:secondary thiamine-phosphate synthase enzyme YjbQ [Mariprofundaceae bacterium]
MRQQQSTLSIRPQGRGMSDITRDVAEQLAQSGIDEGMLYLFVQHTSCSLLIQENADPAVQSDLERFLSRLVPDGDSIFRHIDEGPDDMPAHVRAALTATSLSIPVCSGHMALGVWQGIYLYEHRLHPGMRRVVVHINGV